MTIRFLCALTVALGMAATTASAHDKAHSEKVSTGARGAVVAAKSVQTALAEDERARRYFTDLPVVTHDGRTLRFYSDVLRNRIVLVNLFYAQCKDACPLINQHLSYVQEQLGDRLGKDIFFVSITVDPDNDTPAVLKQYRQNFKARDGWLFLTGEKRDIDVVTRKLGHVLSKEQHISWLLLGNVKKAQWQKLRPNMPQAAIVLKLKALADMPRADRSVGARPSPPG